jgi:hypothetical protein
MVIHTALQALSELGLRNGFGVGVADMLQVHHFAVGTALKWLSIGVIPGGLPSSQLIAPVESSVAPETGIDRDVAHLLVQELKNAVGAVSDDALLVVDDKCHIYASNAAAETCLSSGVFIRNDKGAFAFAFAKPSMTKAFRAGLEVYFSRPSLLRILLDKETLVIYRPAFSQALPLAVVNIRHVSRQIDIPPAELQRMLGITKKQAHMALALMRGLGPIEYSSEYNCTLKAARFHLYGLMSRCECHTQAEVVSFLLRLFG